MGGRGRTLHDDTSGDVSGEGVGSEWGRGWKGKRGKGAGEGGDVNKDEVVQEGVGGGAALERFVHGDHCFGGVFDNGIDPPAREANVGPC